MATSAAAVTGSSATGGSVNSGWRVFGGVFRAGDCTFSRRTGFFRCAGMSALTEKKTNRTLINVNVKLDCRDEFISAGYYQKSNLQELSFM